MSITQFQAPADERAAAGLSLIDSNRSRPPLEMVETLRFADDGDANLDDVIQGGLLSRHTLLDDVHDRQALSDVPFNTEKEEELDRFTLAGAESLPEIGLDEDDIGPGDVVMVLGGMFAITALIFRLRKTPLRIKVPQLPTFGKRRRKRAPRVMSDSDFYPI